MKRTWLMYVWTGRKYEKPTSDGVCLADGPAAALKAFGLDTTDYSIKYSRKGYGHYTGRVEVRLPETAAACEIFPYPADFVLLADK